MDIIKVWKGKNALARCEKECKEVIVCDRKKDIDRIELVSLPYELNAFMVFYKDKQAA